MNIAILIWAILHGFYGFVLAQMDAMNTTQKPPVFRYVGWLIAWPVVLVLIALDRGAYFQD